MHSNISRQVPSLNLENALPRRRLLQAGCAGVLGLTFGSPLANALHHGEGAAKPENAALAPTPECSDGDEPTPRQGAGPFYTPDTPHRASLLEPGLPGTPLVLVGYVLQTTCQPLGNVLLDFWQANDAGRYDNKGYTLRGHQFTAANGQYRLETVVPGLYPGRTRHIHVRIQAPHGRAITTQLYFPDVTQNERDFIYDPLLLVRPLDAPAQRAKAQFDFVLRV
jgi:protocatechuate 3,4-dioxygenase beta subunit